MKTRISTIAIIAATLLLTACSTANLRKDEEVAVVKRGVVVAMQDVTLAGRNTGTGAVIGAATGVLVGTQNIAHKISSNRVIGSTFAGAMIGQLVGAMAGALIETRVTESAGLELTIKLDDGAEIAVPLRRDAVEGINVGDPVRIIQTGGKAKVEKALDRQV